MHACQKSSIRSVGNKIHTYLSLYSARLTNQPTSEIDSAAKIAVIVITKQEWQK